MTPQVRHFCPPPGFHKGCTTDVVPKDGKGWVEFQVNYRFTCKICCSTDNRERFEVTKSSWLESILGGFQNLMYTQQRDMFKVAEVAEHLDKHWDTLCYQRDRGDNKRWKLSLNSYLTNHKNKFQRAKKFHWSLANPDNDPCGPTVQPCRLLKDGHRNQALPDAVLLLAIANSKCQQAHYPVASSTAITKPHHYPYICLV